MPGPLDLASSIKAKLLALLTRNTRYEEFDLGKDGEPATGNYEEEEEWPEPERPPPRHIDKYIRPECPCLTKRYTVAVLACVGFVISFGMRCNMGMAKLEFTTSVPLTEGPKFAEPIPNVTVALGRDASLPCVVDNLGNYKVAWIHIDRQMILTIHRHVIARVSRFSVSHDNHKTWLLNVNQVQQEDRGYYMCQVNTNPMISQVGYLQVVVPPNILDDQSTPSSVAVRENQNVSLTCKADGLPIPKLSWRREDGQPISIDKKTKINIQEGEQLNLTRITRNEMGAYLCIASNSVPPSVSKRIILDVEFSPMIWVPNQLVGAPASTDVTIECNTEAYPKAISYWVYEGIMLLPTKKYVSNIQENSYRTYMKLTVKNLTNRDFGSYRCISKNSLGETEGSIRLYEIPLPSQQPRTTEIGNRAGKDIRKTIQPRRTTTIIPRRTTPFTTTTSSISRRIESSWTSQQFLLTALLIFDSLYFYC